MRQKKVFVGVIGGHHCSRAVEQVAYEIGKGIAALGAVMVCGGLGGVMQAAARGAKENGGLTVGILPGENKNDANPFIDIPVATGLGYTRNTLITTTADIIVALKGEYGTLSEIAFALNAGKAVIGVGSWKIKGMKTASGSKQALAMIKGAVASMQ